MVTDFCLQLNQTRQHLVVDFSKERELRADAGSVAAKRALRKSCE